MLKVSISLPNTAAMTLESQEPELSRLIVETGLPNLLREMAVLAPSADGVRGGGAPEKGTGVTSTSDSVAAPVKPRGGRTRARPGGGVDGTGGDLLGAAPAPVAGSFGATPSQDPGPGTTPQPPPRAWGNAALRPAERAYLDFCRAANPLKDMRRLVVAAEGAARFLGLESVDAAQLERLFDLAGWRRPGNMVQAIRNAARDKFRWLERIPGRAGRYTVTDLGRAVALGK